MGYAEGASAALTQAADEIKLEQLMIVISSFDQVKAHVSDAGDRYVSLFTSQIAIVGDNLREQVAHLQNIKDELTHEAARLLGNY